MAATANSSTHYYPGQPERDALARSHRQQQRIEETVDLQRRFAILNDWVTARGAWLTSLPGDRWVTMECRAESDLPTDLAKRGYDVRPADPPEGQRIVAAARVEDVVTEGSTRTAIRTLREGIVRVLRYTFQL